MSSEICVRMRCTTLPLAASVDAVLSEEELVRGTKAASTWHPAARQRSTARGEV
jgi:hypothetical protein